jgi:hypothetical protein
MMQFDGPQGLFYFRPQDVRLLGRALKYEGPGPGIDRVIRCVWVQGVGEYIRIYDEPQYVAAILDAMGRQ